MKSFNPNQAGFSLVETLVAITILLIVVVGPMTISTSTARSTSFSSEQIVAFFLAQEGAEIVQIVRDKHLLDSIDDPSNDAWVDFRDQMTTACFDPQGCGLELNTNNDGTLKAPILCSGANCRLYVDSGTPGDRSLYTHDAGAGDSSPFTRIIRMDDINSNEIKVISTVEWRTGNQRQTQSVSVESHLFNVYGL